MMKQIKQRIKAHEGFRDTIYKDSLGKATIGWGHLITETDNFQENIEYSVEELENTFEHDFKIALDGADMLISAHLGSVEYSDIPEQNKAIIRGVMIEMVFQLGITGVGKFKQMWFNLDICNFDQASNEMLDSRWYQQTKGRCIELSTIIRNIK